MAIPDTTAKNPAPEAAIPEATRITTLYEALLILPIDEAVGKVTEIAHRNHVTNPIDPKDLQRAMEYFKTIRATPVQGEGIAAYKMIMANQHIKVIEKTLEQIKSGLGDSASTKSTSFEKTLEQAKAKNPATTAPNRDMQVGG